MLVRVGYDELQKSRHTNEQETAFKINMSQFYGQQPSKIESDQDGSNLARISSTVKTLSSRRTSNRGCGHQIKSNQIK